MKALTIRWQDLTRRATVPCLRTDEVWSFIWTSRRCSSAASTKAKPESEIGDAASLRMQAIRVLFQHFSEKGAKACAISLPPDFVPLPKSDIEFRAEPWKA